MPEWYRNEAGKTRLMDEDAIYQSEIRMRWFIEFQTELKRKYPKLFQNVKLSVVGAVAKGQAGKDSDIDVVILQSSSNGQVVPQIRHVIAELLSEMKQAGLTTYEIEIQPVENSLLFSALSMFRKEQAEKRK